MIAAMQLTSGWTIRCPSPVCDCRDLNGPTPLPGRSFPSPESRATLERMTSNDWPLRFVSSSSETCVVCRASLGGVYGRLQRFRIPLRQWPSSCTNDHFCDHNLFAVNHPVWPNQSVLGNGEGHWQFQFGGHMDGQRRADLVIGPVERADRERQHARDRG